MDIEKTRDFILDQQALSARLQAQTSIKLDHLLELQRDAKPRGSRINAALRELRESQRRSDAKLNRLFDKWDLRDDAR